MRSSIILFRAAFFGVGAAIACVAVLAATGSLVACEALNVTSPLFDPDADNSYDAGYVPPPLDTTAPPVTPIDSGPPPSARVRLVNLVQGAGPLDLCYGAGGPLNSKGITANPDAPKPEGLAYGEVSAPLTISVPTAAGSRYQFRVVKVGQDCNGDAGAPGALNLGAFGPVTASGTPSPILQGTGLTVVAVGTEATVVSDSSPRGLTISDNLAPPAASTQLRVFHGVPGLAALDVIINSETVLQGIKYGTAIAFPYSSSDGFAAIAAGVPEGATLILKAGTTARNYTFPKRIRRGVANSIFVSGTAAATVVNLCEDRAPAPGATTAVCTKLEEVK